MAQERRSPTRRGTSLVGGQRRCLLQGCVLGGIAQRFNVSVGSCESVEPQPAILPAAQPLTLALEKEVPVPSQAWPP